MWLSKAFFTGIEENNTNYNRCVELEVYVHVIGIICVSLKCYSEEHSFSNVEDVSMEIQQ